MDTQDNAVSRLDRIVVEQNPHIAQLEERIAKLEEQLEKVGELIDERYNRTMRTLRKHTEYDG